MHCEDFNEDPMPTFKLGEYNHGLLNFDWENPREDFNPSFEILSYKTGAPMTYLKPEIFSYWEKNILGYFDELVDRLAESYEPYTFKTYYKILYSDVYEPDDFDLFEKVVQAVASERYDDMRYTYLFPQRSIYFDKWKRVQQLLQNAKNPQFILSGGMEALD